MKFIPENVSVREDSRLETFEKETTININGNDNQAKIFSAKAGIIRRLIQHPEFTVTAYTKHKENITSITGRIPIGCISIGSKPRKSTSLSAIVSNSVSQKDENASVELVL